jgi:hypothetical protein
MSISACTDQYFVESSSFAKENPSTAFTFTAKPPCCGQCKVVGNAVDIAYWQTPAPEPPVTALVNRLWHFRAIRANSKKSISPSVYGAFYSVSATNLCGRVGPAFDVADFEFDPLDLSTSSFPVNPGLSSKSRRTIRLAGSILCNRLC